MKKAIKSLAAPAAIGPYSQAVRVGDSIYISGQLPINAATGELLIDVKLATKQSLENIKSILQQENATMNDIVKTTVYLSDINDFQDMNDMYANYFDEVAPARSTIQVAELPKKAVLEIEAVAVVKVQ